MRHSASLAVLIGVASIALGDELIRIEVSSLRLRPEVLVEGSAVTLADVITADEADPRLTARFGEIVLADKLGRGGATIRHEQIVEALGRAGVNMSRVLLSGSLACNVRCEAPPDGVTQASTPSPFVDPAPMDAGVAAASGSTAVAPTPPGEAGQAPARAAAVPATGDQTLAARIRRHIAQETASLGGSPQVEFERGAEGLLDLTAPAFDFDIRSTGGRQLGLREVTVIIRRDGKHERTNRVRCNVRLIKAVVVAARALNVGTFIRAEDLRTEERIFDRVDASGDSDMRGLVGKQLRRFVPANEMVGAADVKSADLVKRSRPVTVVSSGGGVSIQLTGVALDSGDLGDSIRVRIGDDRSDRRILRGVVVGLGTVRIEEGG